MRIMITGGGTGGHTSPAVAIIEELQKRDPRLAVQWVGCADSIEERVSKRLAIPFRAVSVEGWPRRNRLRKLWAAAKLGVGVVQAALYLLRFRPQVVLGVGGYVSLPLLWAAQRMGIPTALHEQNKRLGMANRILAPRAGALLLSYPDTLGAYDPAKAVVVGNPVRSGFAHPPDKTSAREALGLDATQPAVLVFGGSQGAHSLNQAMGEAVGKFAEGEVQFLWMTGKQDVAEARAAAEAATVRVDVCPFIDDMVTALAAVDLAVCRSGASTTAELAVMGKPAVLVPYPFATDRHQDENAGAFAAAGAAVVVDDESLNGAMLTETVRNLLAEPRQLASMAKASASLAKPAAVEGIVDKLFSLVFERENPGLAE